MEVCTFDAGSVHHIELPSILTLVLLASKPGRRGRQKKDIVEIAGSVFDADGNEDQVKDVANDCKAHVPTVFYKH